MVVQTRIWLCSLVLLSPVVEAALAIACVRMVDSSLATYPSGIPCGVVTADSGFTTCCNPTDLCVDEGICKFPAAASNGFSGFYMGGCTDPTYLDPSCSPYCRDVARQDIVYNATTKSWACCGTESDGDTVNCADPKGEDFDAPAPSVLKASFTVGSTAVVGSATYTSSSSSTTKTSSSSSSSEASTTTSKTPASNSATQSSSTESSTGSPQPAPSGGLSTGAKAGIGIGVAIVAVVAIAAVLLFLRSRRRKMATQTPDKVPEHVGYENLPVQELPTKESRAEMDGRPVEAHEM